MKKSGGLRRAKATENDENDPALIKRNRAKKIYSFTPTTTPTFLKRNVDKIGNAESNARNAGNKLGVPIAEVSPNVVANKVPTKTPRKRGNPEQGSDDHVYWEMTPNTSGNKRPNFYKRNARNVPSSPLVEAKNDVDPLVPFLKKYNTTLDNLSSQKQNMNKQEAARRSSDPELLENLTDTHDISPTFCRTKSTGLLASNKPSFKQGVSGSMGKDINKLLEAIGDRFKDDVDHEIPNGDTNKEHEDSINSDHELSSELENISALFNKAKKVDENQAVATDDDSDLLPNSFADEFSDIDMEELDNIVAQRSRSTRLSVTVHQEGAQNLNTEEDILDDGLDGLMIEMTQKSQVLKPKFNTQDLLKSDLNNAALFKKEVDKIPSDYYRMSSKNEVGNRAKSAIKKENFHRYQILGVINCKYTKNQKACQQKILTVLAEDNSKQKVIVRDLWESLEFAVNDVIHVIGVNPKIVDAKNNLLVWNPDFMLSATAVGDALVCERRAVLNSRFAFPGESSVPLIVGNIVHSIFQSCLANSNCKTDYIAELIETELQGHLIEILSINETKAGIREEIVKHVPYIQTWFSQFVSNKPKVSIASQGSKESSLVSVSKSLDVEEYIWSPMYGIRGLIDVTVEAYVKKSGFEGKFVTPLELKTGGREQLQHRAQTSLYTLLVKERYNVDSNFFLLLYSKLREMQHHQINTTDLKLLINIRNRISQFLREDVRDLPPLLQQSKCDQCFALEACMTLNNLVEGGTAEDSKLKEGLYESITKEIDGNETYKSFFNHWDTLITKEESVINALKKELWTKTAKEREQFGGKAVGNLRIVESKEDASGFLYTLERVVPKVDDMYSLQNSQLTKHDRVIISDEDGHFALSSGWIVAVRPSFLTVKTDRRIINSFVQMPDFNEQNNQTFKSVLHRDDNMEQQVGTQKITRTYRVDKDEMFHGLALARYNLLNLFLPQVGDSNRRRILVDLKSPRFNSRPLPYTIPEGMTFNSDQQKAFDQVLRAKDFSLILGMPGTGKTTAIAQIIRFLVANGKSVLLASYTHSAVDNILVKLVDDNFPILRTGYVSKVHQAVRKYVPNSGAEGSIVVDSMTQFKQVYIDSQIVATTCLGIGDVVFNHRKNFDYCIIDEASQVSMPVCLGPLRFCDKFILVGDHYQLPPLVISPEAKAGGFDKSLFKMLSDQFPESVVDLSYQYRMCADIMLLSNTLIYEGRLKCGTAEVAEQKLQIPCPEKLNALLKDPTLDDQKHWLKSVFNPNNRVVFLNHDEMPALETVVGEKVQNDIEAELVRQVVQSLIFCGVSEKSIGVMSLYRAQLRLLHRKLTLCKDLEILTADQFQGRDKDCVIISMVRSNDHNSVGDLLKEWRRINVAITRARSKLIILGSKKTMNNLNTLQAFMSIIENRGWMFNLPKDADHLYNVFLDSTQLKSTHSSPKGNKLLHSKAVQNRPLAKNIIDELLG